jgi:hypothetical protein
MHYILRATFVATVAVSGIPIQYDSVILCGQEDIIVTFT